MASLRKDVTVVLGLISFTVSVHSATAAPEVELNMLCIGDPASGDAALRDHPPSRVKQNTACPVCKNNDRGSFERGQEVGGKVVVVPKEEILAMQAGDDVKKRITLTSHPVEQTINMLPTGKTYYLDSQGDPEHYVLMARLVEERSDRALFTEYAVRTAAKLYQLISLNGVLALRELARPEAVKAAPVVDGDVNEGLYGMANAFIDQVTADFDPKQYSDKRAAALASYIGMTEGVDYAFVEGGPAKSSAPKKDLQTMLAEALAAGGADKAATVKKTAAKKPAAKKAAKAPAKKAAAKAS